MVNQPTRHEKINQKGQAEKKKRKCLISNRCGGCQLLDTPYPVQLEQKQKRLAKLLGKFGKVEPIVGMENPFFYRNKVHAVLHRKKDGTIESGIYEEATHNVVPIKKCYIENEKADEIIQSINGLVKSFKIMVYNEKSGYGLLRDVLIRVGHATGEIMVVLVTASPIFPSKNNFAKALLKLHPEITTIVQNINERMTSMVLGTREQVIYGKGYIEDILCGKKFRISAGAFYQINSAQTEILYKKAIKMANCKGTETVIDAYCGTGTIGIIASTDAKEVIGVELNAVAVRDARINAKRNHVKNITFYNNDSGKFMLNLAEQGKQIDVVIMDPPRSGSDENFLKAVLTLAPAKVVYISCEPDTLARDLEILTRENGYKVNRIAPVDMFPHTPHVETVVLLSQLKPDDHIEIDVDTSEFDVTSAEKKATYQQIEQYVMEHTGLKVSNLYIAQVKDKYGLDKRLNYNLPKSENARQPKCPPEKEKAIEEALRHFKMI